MPPAKQLRVLAGASRLAGIAQVGASTYAAADRLRTIPVDKLRVAVHECGHAVALLESESRGVFALGTISMQGLNPAVAGTTQSRLVRKANVLEACDLKQLLVVVLARRAAEHELLGTPTAGAAGDLDVAARIARAYVDLFGGLDDPRAKPSKLIAKAYAQARRLCRRRSTDIHTLAIALYHRERLAPRETKRLLLSTKQGARTRSSSWWPAVLGTNNATKGWWRLERHLTPPPPQPRISTLKRTLRFATSLYSTLYLWLSLAEVLESAATAIEKRETRRAAPPPRRGLRLPAWGSRGGSNAKGGPPPPA